MDLTDKEVTDHITSVESFQDWYDSVGKNTIQKDVTPNQNMLTAGENGNFSEQPQPNGKTEIPEWALACTEETRRNVITSIYLSHDSLEEVNIRLQNKYQLITENEQECETYETDDAELVLIGYGIVSRLIRTVVKELRSQGIKIGMFRPISLFPLAHLKLQNIAESCDSFLCIEMSNGQLIEDIKLSIECSRPVHFLNRMGGNIPSVEEITKKVKEILAEKL